MKTTDWMKLAVAVPRMYVNAKRFKSRPLAAIIDVSLHCPASCKYCATWMIDHENLDTEGLIKIVQKLRRIGVATLGLSGGEPMIRRDLPDIVRAGVDEGMLVSVITSGLVDLEQRFRELLDAGISTITFTVDGATAETHETFRDGTDFEKLIRAIKTAVRLRDEGGYAARINAQTVITRQNIESIAEIVEFVRDLGVDHTNFQPVWPTLDFENFVEKFGFDENDEELLCQARDVLAEVPNGSLREYVELLPDFYTDYGKIEREVECYAGRAYIHVNYKGELLPCAFYPETFGSILDEEPEDLLSGDKHKRMLAEAADQSGCSGCSLSCHMERNLMLRALEKPSAWPQLLTERFSRRKRSKA